MIELENVHKVFNPGQPNEYCAVQGINLYLHAGEITVLRGPSGSGKTTLLTLIGALARPTSGRVRLHGEAISALPERFLTEVRRQHFGFVFQQFNLIRGLAVLDNVMLPAFPQGIPRPMLLEKAWTLLEQLKLTHRATAQVEWLSGGEQQRVAIARALINDPELLIADEPTANLDTALSHQFLDILAQLQDGGKTILLTSHDPLVVESPLMQRIISLRDGRIVDEGQGE
jgi:putative ABC transport system ATP-binding protein